MLWHTVFNDTTSLHQIYLYFQFASNAPLLYLTFQHSKVAYILYHDSKLQKSNKPRNNAQCNACYIKTVHHYQVSSFH